MANEGGAGGGWISGIDIERARRAVNKRTLALAVASELDYVEAPAQSERGRCVRAKLGSGSAARVETYAVVLWSTDGKHGIVSECSRCVPVFGPCSHVATVLVDIALSPELRSALVEGRVTAETCARAVERRAAHNLDCNFDSALGAWLLPAAGATKVEIAASPFIQSNVYLGHSYGDRHDPADARAIAIGVRRSGERKLLSPREVATLPLAPRDRRVVEHARDLGQGRKATYATGVDASLALEAMRAHGGIFAEGHKRLLEFRTEVLRPTVMLRLADTASAPMPFDALSAHWVSADGERRFTFADSVFFPGPFAFVWTKGGALYPVRSDVDPDFVRELVRAPVLYVPPGRLKDAGARLLRATRGRGIVLPSPDAFGLAPVETPRIVLRLTGEPLDVIGELIAVYQARQILLEGAAGAGGLDLMASDSNDRDSSERDLECEARAQGHIEQAGLALAPPEGAEHEPKRRGVSGERAVAFWQAGILALRAHDNPTIEVELSERLARVRVGVPLTGRVRVALEGNWLDTRLEFGSNELPVELEAIRAALSRKQRWVTLSDGTLAQISSSVQALADQADSVMGGQARARLPMHQLGRIDRWVEENDGRIDAAVDALRGKLRALAVAAQPEMPEGLRAILRPYQRLGVAWLQFLQALGAGGILADDMGLGKTITTLAFLLRRKEAEGPAPSLVVCPTSVATNWVREAERFTPDLRIVLYTGSARDPGAIGRSDLTITTYAILRRDVDVLSQVPLRCAVLDEAQNVKNADSETARAARRLCASMRLALSGTPVENRLRELWSLASFANPGILGTSRAFETRFEKPIAADRESPLAPELRAIVRPFLLRRTKNDVLADLPPKTEIDRVVTLKTEGKRLYDALAHTLRASVAKDIEKRGLAQSSLSVFTALTRLRQMACDPRLVDPRFAPADSAKREAFLDLVRELVAQRRRALVFSQFVELLTLWRRDLDTEEIAYEYLDGKSIRRDAIVSRFQEGKAPLFLISLKAGGAGLNLTAADTVIHCDPWWNPAVEDQATDRAHRIGQNKPVTVVRLVASGTIEEKILSLKAKKRELTRAVIGDDARALAGISEDDIRLLLGDADGEDGDAVEEELAKRGREGAPNRRAPTDAIATAKRPIGPEFAAIASQARRWLETTGRLESDLAAVVEIPVAYASRLARGEPFPCSRAVAERIRTRLRDW
jgi:hypothetical protein